MANDYGITLDDAINELQAEVEEAINFMWSEFEDSWAKAERYFAGECDLPTNAGRSDAVKSEVRDIIRAVLPNVMRVLYQARKPVEYLPSNIKHAAFVDQQGLFIEQLFKKSGGYKILYNAVMQAMKLKNGPIKVWYEEDPMPEYFEFSSLSADEVDQLKNMKDIEVEEVTEHPKLGEDGFFNVKGRRFKPFGNIVIEDFPIYEFFVSRNANNLENARVHGHHRQVTVAEAIEMGLEYDDWADLVGTSPENKHAAASSRARRGYQTDADGDDSEDLLQKKILLTEVYCKYDLDGDGVNERYCFYLGGDSYKYITHHEIEDYCIELVSVDPQPYTVISRSLADILIEMQDNETSILRAIIDNAHMSNNPRIAGDPNNVDFNDVMNNATGAPIKTRGDQRIQVINIPFTGHTLMPFLQYLEVSTEQRVGVTKAATGLDPDALQSTDKEAVRSTIQLSQGQAELMARNVVETGLIGIFKKLLRLASRHLDRYQVVRTRGLVLPVDITTFDPDLAAEPNVGLGTASHEEKLATLNFIMQKQEQIIGAFGFDNPFTSLSQMYNTLEDIVDLGGLKDPGRYFQVVTQQMEAQIAKAQAEQQAAANAQAQQQQPMDPSAALLQSEQMKARTKMAELQAEMRKVQQELEIKQQHFDEEMGFKRDELAQDRIIKLRELSEQRQARLSQEIERAQQNNDEPDRTGGTRATGSGQETGT